MAAKNAPRRKHVPQRTCVVCREKHDKRALIRVVHTPEEGVIMDATGRRNGRGAYLCTKQACWDAALQGNALDHALRTQITQLEKQLLRAQRSATAQAQ
jgi:predicted RNA-binding protein YlxR (DUF448 family)